MNIKLTLTTLAAAATMAVGGLAIAQGNPVTSTPGAGCTATANAMRGGNLGGSATNKDCVSNPAPTAAAPAPMMAQPAVVQAPAPAAPMMAATPAPAPEMVATATRRPRADRN
ncbi:hypothetical protein [Caenimonas koreensis]|uniref:hypothetical protein n=1 Tax=Caenimonas koreensis TaxID=367474 RepID=UPI0037836F78